MAILISQKRDEAHQHEKTRQRKRLLVGAITLVSILALAAVGFGVHFRTQYHINKKRKEAAYSREAKVIWGARAESASGKKEYPQTLLYAARALGFHGYGFEKLPAEESDPFKKKISKLFDFEARSVLYNDLRAYIDGPVKPFLPIWSSPVTNHHKDPIYTVSFSPDGKTLASGHWAAPSIKLWDLETGTLKDTLKGHGNEITHVIFSPDGKTLVSGSVDKTIKLWDVANAINRWNVENPLNLASYISDKWYAFDKETGEARPSYNVLDNLYTQRVFGFLNVGPWTHVGVLQSAKDPAEQNRELYNHYLYGNHAWSGALALLDQPMDEEPDATLIARHIAELGWEEEARDIAEILFKRLQNTGWGKTRLASTKTIDSLVLGDEEKIILTRMLGDP